MREGPGQESGLGKESSVEAAAGIRRGGRELVALDLLSLLFARLLPLHSCHIGSRAAHGACAARPLGNFLLLEEPGSGSRSSCFPPAFPQNALAPASFPTKPTLSGPGKGGVCD